MKKTIISLLVIFCCAACATPEQIALRRQQQAAYDTSVCESYGFQAGSEAFGMCRLQLDLARQQRYEDDYVSSPRPYFRNDIYHWRR